MKWLIQHRIHVLVCIIPLVIIIVGLFGLAIIHGFWIVCAALAAIALYSFIAKDRFDTQLTIGLLVTFIVARMLFPGLDQETLIYRTAAVSAFVLLHIVLLIGPWARFSRWVRKHYKDRRHLGVTVFFLGLLHAGTVFRTYFSASIPATFQAVFAFFGFTALFIFTILALTSWDWVQKNISRKQWSIIHTAVLALFALILGYYLHLQSAIPSAGLDRLIVFVPIAFVIFGLAIAPYGIVQKLFHQVNGWKQLHVLIYIAYVSLLFHVWLGVGYFQAVWVQVLFWIGLAVVFGSHAFGWFVKWKEDRYFRNRVKKIDQQFFKNGRTWIGLAKTQEFTEMKGEKFIVQGIPMAVFLFKGEYRAINNSCAHQKGPLYQGEVTGAGYVVCPWHQYAFNIKDGKGPAGYKDCVAHYDTQVKDGIIYVAV